MVKGFFAKNVSNVRPEFAAFFPIQQNAKISKADCDVGGTRLL